MPKFPDESPPSEKYGFVIHVLCFPLAIVYLIWAFLPPETLHALNITYYPSQDWAVLLPAYFLCIFVAAPLLYAACNIRFTPKVDSIYTIFDGSSKSSSPPPFVDNLEQTRAFARDDATLPEIYDIDVGEINRLVYNKSQR